MDKNERIKKRLKKVGSRKDRHLRKYSNKFLEMFEFYFKIKRYGIIDFCGSNVHVKFNLDSEDGMFTFREYDNGRFNNKYPVSRHPNILSTVIQGKKGWGLWVKLWTEGIVDCTFTKEEILKEFEKHNIIIPKPLMTEWDKLITKMKCERNLEYLSKL